MEVVDHKRRDRRTVGAVVFRKRLEWYGVPEKYINLVADEIRGSNVLQGALRCEKADGIGPVLSADAPMTTIISVSQYSEPKSRLSEYSTLDL